MRKGGIGAHNHGDILLGSAGNGRLHAEGDDISVAYVFVILVDIFNALLLEKGQIPAVNFLAVGAVVLHLRYGGDGSVGGLSFKVGIDRDGHDLILIDNFLSRQGTRALPG